MASKGSRNLTYGLGVFAVTGFVAIAVIVLVGFMYTTSAECAKTHAGWADEPLDLNSYGLSNNTLVLEFVNSGTDQIRLKNINIYRKDSTVVSQELERNLHVGASTTIRLGKFNRSRSCNSFQLDLSYDTTSLKDLEADGRITWSIEG
ncbi:MAG: hypothetical protein ABEJ69_02520 [Candidatus Nanohaloarchaea archaeon]